jgi:hypothetical protein
VPLFLELFQERRLPPCGTCNAAYHFLCVDLRPPFYGGMLPCVWVAGGGSRQLVGLRQAEENNSNWWLI